MAETAPPEDPSVPDEDMADQEDEDEANGDESQQPLHEDADMQQENADDEASQGDDNNDEMDTKDEADDEDIEEDEGSEDDVEEEEDLSSAAPPPRKKDPRSRKRRRRDKMFQDCVSIHVPLDLTADLGIAMRRTRRKRIEALTQTFPELIAEKKANEAEAKETAIDSSIKGDTTMEGDEEEDGEGPKGNISKADPNSSPRKNLSHVPKREDYANVVDYLEAKYVQGVMINDDEDDDPQQGEAGGQGAADEDDEGQGSVYSQSSFLDDRDLQRDVAEQVLAQSTTTKLELESNNDDAFFVNVGNLEVEESDLTKEGYDPVNDVENVKKPKKKRKPAEPKDKNDSKSTASPDKSKEKKKPVAKAASKGKETKPSTAAKKKSDGAESPKKKAKPADKATEPKKKKKRPPTEAEKAAAAKKRAVDKAYKEVVQTIKAMSTDDLPRRKTTEKVAITCPPDKKPGDSVLFANPHVPGQRLKVKIPKKATPGGTFKVSVPIANPEDGSDNTDHNRWSREFYDCFGDYCTLYDEWVELVAVVKQEKNITDFVVYFEKRNKFDDLINDVPQNLKTPLDKAYFQKLLRRARQNRHKRERTQKRQEEKAKELLVDQSDDDKDDVKSTGASPEKKTEDEEDENDDGDDDAASRTVFVPHLSSEFPTIKFHAGEW